jgi:hypothetical protein
VVALPGYSRPLIRVRDYLALLEESHLRRDACPLERRHPEADPPRLATVVAVDRDLLNPQALIDPRSTASALEVD